MTLTRLLIPIFLSIFLILSDYRFSYLDNIKQHIATAVSPIYLVVNLPAQLYYWISEQGSEKELLIQKNKDLDLQLLELKAKFQNYNELQLENKKLKELLGSSYTLKDSQFILSRVTKVSQSRLKKQLVINKGSDNGIEVGQVVLGAQGIIGQVTQTTPVYATVLMASDPTQHIPVKNARNGIRGISKGSASKTPTMKVQFIESESDVEVGDLFVSSAIGSKFPKGYPLGVVTQKQVLPNEPFLNIELEPLQTTKKLEFVLVGKFHSLKE